MSSDNSDWLPPEDDVEYLSGLCGRLTLAIIAVGLHDKVPKWKIGKAAGFSPGRTEDEGKRRSNWGAAVSSASRKHGKELESITQLKIHLANFRKGGGAKPLEVSREQLKERLGFLALHGSDASSIRAAEALERMRAEESGKVSGRLDTRAVVAELVRRIGREKASWLLYGTAENLLGFVDDCEERLDSELLQAISDANSFAEFRKSQTVTEIADDMDRRLTALEARS